MLLSQNKLYVIVHVHQDIIGVCLKLHHIWKRKSDTSQKQKNDKNIIYSSSLKNLLIHQLAVEPQYIKKKMNVKASFAHKFKIFDYI